MTAIHAMSAHLASNLALAGGGDDVADLSRIYWFQILDEVKAMVPPSLFAHAETIQFKYIWNIDDRLQIHFCFDRVQEKVRVLRGGP